MQTLSASVWPALADPTRQHILEMLAESERSAGEIAAEFTMSGPAVSQHLKILRDAKLVTVRAEAQKRIYALDRDGFAAIDAWLAQLRGIQHVPPVGSSTEATSNWSSVLAKLGV